MGSGITQQRVKNKVGWGVVNEGNGMSSWGDFVGKTKDSLAGKSVQERIPVRITKKTRAVTCAPIPCEKNKRRAGMTR